MRDAEVLVLSFTDHGRDPRLHRQLSTLAGSYRVVAAGTGDAGIDGTRFVPLGAVSKGPAGLALGGLRLLGRRFESYYWNTAMVRESLRRLSGLRPDVVLANDLDTLPLALRVAGDAPVLFDAHEYAPREFEDMRSFRLFYMRYREALCRTYIPRARARTTVGPRIAQEYAATTGVHPEVIWNAPEGAPLRPAPPASDGRIRLVHHGGAQRSRRLELMIALMRLLDDRFLLDLVLVGHDAAYFAELRALAGDDGRIRFRDPVPMQKLPAFLNQYDVGLFLLPPTNFNYRYALPNKFFEFVQARLAIAIGPSPEMARLVEEHDLGVVSADFTPANLAARLRGLDAAAVAAFKENAHRAAPQLSAGPGRRTLLRLVEDALRRGES